MGDAVGFIQRNYNIIDNVWESCSANNHQNIQLESKSDQSTLLVRLLLPQNKYAYLNQNYQSYHAATIGHLQLLA